MRPEFKLTAAEQKTLLELARFSLTARVRDQRRYTPPEDLLTDGLRQTAGAFVTLHKAGALRGCIGEIMPQRALYEAVLDHAVHAGLHDPRFPAVTGEELERLRFEISALTPPQEIEGPAGIQIGRHGVVLEKQGRSAVFLPQVAPEQGWDVEQTLTHLALKAGLRPDAWRADAAFRVFEAIVFGE
jgi:AmmeMemoRadiSam system protein A